MDAELLAKTMRERAVRIEIEQSGGKARRKSRELPKLEYKSIDDRIEELKKLYFNAGRWAGGARDHNARQAFERLKVADANL